MDAHGGSGSVPGGPTEIERAAWVAEAKAAVIAAGPLLTAAEVTALLHGAGPDGFPDLIALPTEGGGYLYPAFQFDKDTGRVRPIVLEVNGAALLDARHDPWAVASWWTQPDGRLGGRSPASILGTDEETRVLTMAQATVSDWG